jgi:cobalt-precorrin-5B (C1)-methyltransferase
VAAVRFLLGRPCGWILLNLPSLRIGIPVSGVERIEGGARAWVHKDAGDDPDVTDGMAVVAEVRLEWGDRPLLSLEGGEGVGRVSRPGLQVPPGEPAINPGPRAAIEANLAAELPPRLGARVRISIPGGQEVAKRTFNPRLGVVGGLSILGTTGVVEPRSEAALVETTRTELSVLRAAGAEAVCLAPGNYGRGVAANLGIPDGSVVATGNFVGPAVDDAARLGFGTILLIAQIGKLLKVSGGSMDTHSAKSDGRLCALGAFAAACGAGASEVREILSANTADEAALAATDRPWGAEALRMAANRAEMSLRGRFGRAVGTDAEIREDRGGSSSIWIGALAFALPDRELARSSGASAALSKLLLQGAKDGDGGERERKAEET